MACCFPDKNRFVEMQVTADIATPASEYATKPNRSGKRTVESALVKHGRSAEEILLACFEAVPGDFQAPILVKSRLLQRNPFMFFITFL